MTDLKRILDEARTYETHRAALSELSRRAPQLAAALLKAEEALVDVRDNYVTKGQGAWLRIDAALAEISSIMGGGE